MPSPGFPQRGTRIEQENWESLRSWESWFPDWTNLTIGDGTNEGYFYEIGPLVFFRLVFTYGTTSAVGTAPRFTLPRQARWGASLGTNHTRLFGQARCFDSGSSAYYPGECNLYSHTEGVVSVLNAAGTYLTRANITATAPFTWASGDELLVDGHYQRLD